MIPEEFFELYVKDNEIEFWRSNHVGRKIFCAETACGVCSLRLICDVHFIERPSVLKNLL